MATEHRDVITQNTLKAILRTLGASGRKGDVQAFRKFTALHQVQCHIQTLEDLRIDHQILVEYAVKEVLIEAIQCQLVEARITLNIPTPPLQEKVSRDQALHEIERDTQTQSPYLIGWSLLYYLYVRADLNISLNEFADHSYVDARTIRRYRGQATNALLKYLIRVEIELAYR